jgi:hypothetical protein
MSEKQKTRYVVGRSHVVKPGVNDRCEAVVEYIPDLVYGIHNSNIDAKRAYCAAFYPSMADREQVSDDFIKQFFHGETWGSTAAKILKFEVTA